MACWVECEKSLLHSAVRFPSYVKFDLMSALKSVFATIGFGFGICGVFSFLLIAPSKFDADAGSKNSVI